MVPQRSQSKPLEIAGEEFLVQTIGLTNNHTYRMLYALHKATEVLIMHIH